MCRRRRSAASALGGPAALPRPPVCRHLLPAALDGSSSSLQPPRCPPCPSRASARLYSLHRPLLAPSDSVSAAPGPLAAREAEQRVPKAAALPSALAASMAAQGLRPKVQIGQWEQGRPASSQRKPGGKQPWMPERPPIALCSIRHHQHAGAGSAIGASAPAEGTRPGRQQGLRHSQPARAWRGQGRPVRPCRGRGKALRGGWSSSAALAASIPRCHSSAPGAASLLLQRVFLAWQQRDLNGDARGGGAR